MNNQSLPAVMPVNKGALALESALDYSNRELLDALKKTVATGTSDAEFKVFVELCKVSGLNPLQKQIWCFKSGDKLITMAGINGFFEVANNHPAFDGLELESDNPTSPTFVTCKVYRKDRSRPSVGTALLKEFKKNTPIWNSMPYHMLCKVAKAIALREAFPQKLSGLYIPEEVEGERPSKLSELRSMETIPPNATPDTGVKNNKLQALLTAFEMEGVFLGQLEAYLGCKLADAEDEQIADLRNVFKEIKSGVDPETWFTKSVGVEVVA